MRQEISERKQKMSKSMDVGNFEWLGKRSSGTSLDEVFILQ